MPPLLISWLRAHPRGLGGPSIPNPFLEEAGSFLGRGGRGSGRLRLGPRQEQLRLSHARYLQDHPDAEAVISDFLLFLLLHKPADVVTFAAEHFSMLSAHWEPDATLGSSNRRSPFRSPDPEFL